MAKPIILGEREFRTKTELQTYLSRMRSEATLKEPVHADLDSVLRDLVMFHPDWERKIGVGIQQFTVRFMPPNSTAFWIERIDGTIEDFSFHKCIQHINGAGFREREVKVKLREMVRDAIDSFRGTLPEVTVCTLTGVSLRRNEAHIDHAFPNTFSAIVRRFLVSERLEWHTFPISYSGDPRIGRIVTDQAVASRWHEFHAINCHLRPVDPSINSKIGDSDPAEHQAVVSLFTKWIDDNRIHCHEAEHREYMMPRIREVFYAHPKKLTQIEDGHKWLASHPEDVDPYVNQWIDWIFPQDRRAA